MGGFFPSFPFYIPHSPGMPHWWDIFWWSWQLIVMGAVLLGVRAMALRYDRDRDSEQFGARQSVARESVPPNGPGIPG
jgi:hypothetical protein